MESPEGAEAANLWSKRIIGAAIEVHRHMGPGLLESVYEECLAIEMAHRGIPFERQKSLPIAYQGRRLEGVLKADFVVARIVVLELKAVEAFLPVHEAQLHTYLRLTGLTLGLLLNFNVPVLSDGIRRRVLQFPDSASLRLCGE